MQTIIHVGFPKTATTYLQKNYFPRLAAQKVVNFIYLDNDQGFIKRLCADDYLNFDVSRYPIEDKLSREQCNVISYEGFLGLAKLKHSTAYINALKLRDVFPSASILIVIRNQVDELISLYKQSVHEGATHSIEKFLNFRNGKFVPSSRLDDNTLNLDFYRYSRIINTYSRLFGSKVHVTTYENLWNNIYGLPTTLSLITGEPKELFEEHDLSTGENVSYGYWQLKIARKLNRFFPSTYNQHGLYFPIGRRHPLPRNILQSPPVAGFFSKKFAVSPSLRAAIKAYYKDDNADLKNSGIELPTDYF